MHVSEQDLALYAGGELSWFGRWTLTRHLKNCPQCQTSAHKYEAVVEELHDAINPLPELNWDRLEAEIKANVRLGISAGAVVAQAPATAYSFRPALVLASALSVVMAAWLFLGPRAAKAPASDAMASMVEATRDGIEFSGQGRSVALRTTGKMEVISVRLGGSVGSRSVDAESGQVTINHVYVQ